MPFNEPFSTRRCCNDNMIIYRYGKADSTHNKRLLESSMQTGCSPQTIKLLKMGSVDFRESFLYLELKLHFVLKLHVENILHSVFHLCVFVAYKQST